MDVRGDWFVMASGRGRRARVVFILTVVLAGGLAAAGLARAATVAGTPLEALASVVAAEDTHDWDALLALTASCDRADLAAFLANDQNRAQYLGVFNIEWAALVEVKELPERIAAGVADVAHYRGLYGQAVVFYAGVCYQVRNEDRYYYNGVNYRLAVVVPESGEWRLAESSAAPVERLAAGEAAFGSGSELVAAEICRARDRGLIINAAGDVIGHLDSEAQQTGAPPVTAPSCPPPSLTAHRAPPSARGAAAALAGAAVVGLAGGLCRLPRGPSWRRRRAAQP